jgi:hypothetical protein
MAAYGMLLPTTGSLDPRSVRHAIAAPAWPSPAAARMAYVSDSGVRAECTPDAALHLRRTARSPVVFACLRACQNLQVCASAYATRTCNTTTKRRLCLVTLAKCISGVSNSLR